MMVRLWSLHPKYLDAKGLVAAWREALLAQKVLRGKTKGYRNHPQLIRFRDSPSPVGCIAAFLAEIAKEGARRGYSFDASKIARQRNGGRQKIVVTQRQVAYEFALLKSKLAVRDPKKLRELRSEKVVQVHPVFRVIEGDIAEWEKVKEVR